MGRGAQKADYQQNDFQIVAFSNASNALYKVLSRKKNISIADYRLPHKTNFLELKVSSSRAVRILANQEIQIEEGQASVILNLMYVLAKT